MEKQISFAQSEYAGMKRVTGGERFEEVERVAMGEGWWGMIESHYPNNKRRHGM